MLLSKKVKIPPWSPWFDIYPGSQAIHFGWKNYPDFVRTAFQIGSSLRFNLGWWQWFRMVTAIQLFLEVQCIDVTQPKIVGFMWGSHGLSFRLLKEMDSYSYEFSTLSSRMPLKVIFVYVSRVFTAISVKCVFCGHKSTRIVQSLLTATRLRFCGNFSRWTVAVCGNLFGPKK